MQLNLMQTNIKLVMFVLEIHLHELNLIQNKAEIPKQMQVKENLQHNNNMRTNMQTISAIAINHEQLL